MRLRSRPNAALAVLTSVAVALNPLLVRVAYADLEDEGPTETFRFTEADPHAREASHADAREAALKVRTAPVDTTGAYTHSFGFDVPPGRLGMTPSLGANYSSGRRKAVSEVGVGWELVVPSIRRSTRDGFPPLAAGDTTQLTGAIALAYDDEAAMFESSLGPLARAVDGPSGATGILYMPLRETQPTRFELIEDDDGGHWIEHDPSGVKRYYGSSPDGGEMRLNNELGTHAWYLLMEEDPHGNHITYEYWNAEEQSRAGDALLAAQRTPIPRRVTWGGNRGQGLPHLFQLQMSIESGSRCVDGSDAQALEHFSIDMMNGHVLVDQCIKSIEVGTTAGEVFWTYDLVYQVSPITRRLLLAELRRDDPQERTQLTYTNEQPQFAEPEDLVDPSTPNETWAYTKRNPCPGGLPCEPTLAELLTPRGLRGATRFVDFDGDSDTDIVYHPAGLDTPMSRILYDLSLSREPSGGLEPVFPTLPPGALLTDLGDVDGDGDTDGVFFSVHIDEDEGRSIQIEPGVDLPDACDVAAERCERGRLPPWGPGPPPPIDIFGSGFPVGGHCGGLPFFNADVPGLMDAGFPTFGGFGDPFSGIWVPPFQEPHAQPSSSGFVDPACLPYQAFCVGRDGPGLGGGRPGRPTGPLPPRPQPRPRPWPIPGGVPPPTDPPPGGWGSGSAGATWLDDFYDSMEPAKPVEVMLYRNLAVPGLPSHWQLLAGWPRGVVKEVEIGQRKARVGGALVPTLNVTKDFHAPLVDVNGDGRQDIVLVKAFWDTLLGMAGMPYDEDDAPRPAMTLWQHEFHPRVYRYDTATGVWRLEWLTGVSNERATGVTAFTDSLHRILRSSDGLAPHCALCGDELYPPSVNFSTYFADVNADGLVDLIAAYPPNQSTGKCRFGHQVFLNRGYRWEARGEEGKTATGLAWSSSSAWPDHAHPFSLLRNRNQQCPATRELSAALFVGLPGAVMSLNDINSDGRPDVIFYYVSHEGGPSSSGAQLQERVYLNTGRGFRLSGERLLPGLANGSRGFAIMSEEALALYRPYGNPFSAPDMGRLVDIDDDGMLDLVRPGFAPARSTFFPADSGTPPRVFRNTSPPPDLMTKVRASSGAWTRIEYVAATGPRAAEVIPGARGQVPPGHLVVSKIERARGPIDAGDAWAGTNVPAWGEAPFTYAVETISLEYDSFVRDRDTSEAIGFARVKATFFNRDAAGSSLGDLVVARDYDVTRCPEGLTVCVPFALKGTPTRIEAQSGQSRQTTWARYVLTNVGEGARIRPWKTITEDCSSAAIVGVATTGETCRASQQTLSDFDGNGFARRSLSGNSDFGTSGVELAAAQVVDDYEDVEVVTSYDHLEEPWILGLRATENTTGFRQDINGAGVDGAALSTHDWTYTATGLLETETRAKITPDSCAGETGATTTYSYPLPDGALGLVGSTSYPEGRVVTVTYDDAKLYVETQATEVGEHRYPDGYVHPRTTLVEGFAHDLRHGGRTSYTDANGNTFTTVYDSRGRPLSESGPLGLLRAYAYVDTAPARITETVFRTLSARSVKRSYLDGDGNVLAVAEQPETGSIAWASAGAVRALRSSAFEYDAFGREITSYLPRFASSLTDVAVAADEPATRSVYDGFDRPLWRELPGERVTTWVYGAGVEVETNPRLTQTRRTYDWRDDVVEVARFEPGAAGASLGVYTYVRDGLGAINEIIDPDLLVRNLERDRAGRLFRANLPHATGKATGVFELCYDLEDNLIELRTPSERTATVIRDVLGRPVENLASLDAEVITQYLRYDDAAEDNARARLSGVSDNSGVWTFGYDEHGRRKSVGYWPSAAVRDVAPALEGPYTVHLSYDWQGGLTSFSLDGLGGVVEVGYGRDQMGMAVNVTSTAKSGVAPLAYGVKYDAQRRLRRAGFGNGTATKWSFDPVTQFLTDVDFFDNEDVVFSALAYRDYDANGNVGTESRLGYLGQERSYKHHEYDWLDRLMQTDLRIGWAGIDTALEYTYSDGGNIETAAGQTYAYDAKWNGQAATSLSGAGSWRTLAYDKDGALFTDIGDATRTFGYDAAGCLRQVEERDGATLLSETSNICGPDGKRLVRTTTRYASGPQTETVIQLGGVGELRPAERVFLLRLPLTGTTVVEEARWLEDGSRMSAESGYIHSDMRGSVLARSTYYEPSLGTAVEVVDEAEYGPWGETLGISELPAPVHQFTGLEPDPGTDLYYFGKRAYDPSLRRWVSPDPLMLQLPERAEADGLELNLYSYARNNPVRVVDSTGLEGDEAQGKGWWERFKDWVAAQLGLGEKAKKAAEKTQSAVGRKGNYSYVEDMDDAAEGIVYEKHNERIKETTDEAVKTGVEVIAIATPVPAAAPIKIVKQMLSTSRVIAKGSRIRAVGRLVRTYGGRARDWVKKSAVDDLGREIHWYENARIGKRVEEKVKQ